MSAELEEALRLREAAREHMRAARRSRRRARDCMEQLDRLITAAAARGVHIQINTTAKPEGGPSGHEDSSEGRERESRRERAAAEAQHARA